MVNYLVFLTISAGLFAIFALGLNLQWGIAGLINFGHVAFMTLGAYATVLLCLKGVPLILAVLLGMGLAALLGLLVGITTLRLREDYLAIVTIGVSELLRLVVLNEDWLTRGAFGVQRYPLPLENFRPNLLGKYTMIALLTLVAIYGAWQLFRGIKGQLKTRQWGKLAWGITAAALLLTIYSSGVIALYDYDYKAGLMLVVLIALATVYALLEFVVNSPWGRVLKAIREDEEVPRALGKNVFWYKLQALMLGGAIAGGAGSLYAWQLTNVYPTNFDPAVTFNAWIMVVLGGAGSNPGAILGSVIYWAYDALTRFGLPALGLMDSARLGAFRIMVIGLIMMALMLWRSQGILGNKDELTLGR